MRLLDLFCGRWGWSAAFAARGWSGVGVDLTEYPRPRGFEYVNLDILSLTAEWIRQGQFDFIVASSPCEEFSIHGMKHFHPNPKYPETGIKLFNHTRAICEASGLPYVMENVRPAQRFIGASVHQCGPFHLWGNAVPVLMPQGITKGIDVGSSKLVKTMTKEERRVYRAQFPWNQSWPTLKKRGRDTAKAATIPFILASAVAAYAEQCVGKVA